MTTPIERLEELAGKATARPWRVGGNQVKNWVYVDTGAVLQAFSEGQWPHGDGPGNRDANAAFIVAAVNALPDLIRAVRALVATAWNERDGRCWCATSPETRNGRHEPRCALARAALQPLFREEPGDG